jgi:quaternary ammonium compound-resistance protein SugE
VAIAWAYLIAAGLCEVGWPIGLKWTQEIGAAGTFLVGVWFFGDPSSFGRWLGASLIIAGVITLKLAH